MRITDIHIENYGPHSDWSPGDGGIPSGLCVLLGPNEAGKSAIRAFIRMVLFGRMRANSPDARRFNYTHLGGETGAGSLSLQTADRRGYTVHRVEGGAVTVSGDESGTEELLQSLIGRIDSTLYQNVFSISLIELESMESLSGDAVRDRIYSAGLGLGSVSLPAARKRLEDERSLPSGLWSDRAGSLRKNLRELAAARSELQEKAATLAGYEQLTREIADLEEKVSALQVRWEVETSRALRLKNVNELRRPAKRRLSLLSELGALPDAKSVPPFPADGVERLDRLKRDIDSLREKVSAGEIRGASINAEVGELSIAASFNDAESEILRLLGETARYEWAARDLPRVERSADGTKLEISTALAALGDGWDEQHLDTFTDHAGATSSLNTAGKSLSDARTEVALLANEDERASSGLEEEARDEGAARRAVERITNVPAESADDLRARRARLDRMRSAVAELTQRRLAGIGPAGGRRPLIVRVLARLFRGIMSVLRRVSGRPASAPSEDRIGPSADAESEVESLAASLRVDPRATDRELLELTSEADRGIERRAEHDRAQAALTEASARREQAAADAAAAGNTLEASRLKLRDAEQRWLASLGSLGLAASLDLPGAISALGEVKSLQEKLKSAKDLRGRVSDMKGALADIEDSLRPVLEAAGMRGFELHNAGPALHELEDRFRSHRDAMAQSQTLRQQLDSWIAEKSVLQAGMERLETESAELISGAGSDDEESFRRLAAEDERRRSLQREISQLETDYPALTDTGEESITHEIESTAQEDVEATRLLAVEDADRLREEIGALREELGGLQKSRADAEESNPTTEIQEEIDRLEQVVGQEAKRWAVLTIARQLLDETRTAYQSERQAPLMTSASAHFNLFAGGAYTRVEAVIDEENIQVVASSGRVTPVTELSRGTAEQLYLAMRFAFIDEYVRHTEPMPVLMDDVMVNFDPNRALAVSHALVELSETHQVLVLTCHPGTVSQLEEAAEAKGATAPAVIQL